MSELDNVNTSFEAEQVQEAIEAGDLKAPKVDVEADYELSKQYEVAQIDRTDAGARAAEAAVAPNITEVSNFSSEDTSNSGANLDNNGDPDAFREMAKEVNPLL